MVEVMRAAGAVMDGGRSVLSPLKLFIILTSPYHISEPVALSVLLLKDLSPASQLSDAILVIMASRPGTR